MDSQTSLKSYDVKDINLASAGKARIEWAGREMPVLQQIRDEFQKQKPLRNLRISACLHVTSETANLVKALADGGADVVLCASNPLSTQDDVAASLVVHDNIRVYAIKGEDEGTYYRHIDTAIQHQPHITMDDGCDLVSTLHKSYQDLLANVIFGTEETTTGVIRLKSMESQGALKYPVLAVNESATKHLFDNRYGTGQSTIDAIIRTTNILLAGKVFVVCGYGWCGRGIASRARGMGARVIVTEVHPVRALEAAMDGYEVMPLLDAAPLGDFFVTATGDVNVIDEHHLMQIKDKAILANAGHFNDEINLDALEKLSESHHAVRSFTEEYNLSNGKKLYVLAEGRLVNLSAAEGHPASVMDLSFANQALGLKYMLSEKANLETRVYTLPDAIDQSIASMKLHSMKMKIDTLTPEQVSYLASWESGT